MPRVIVLYGDTGVGKTRSVFRAHDIHSIYTLEKVGGHELWFDGYTNQEVLLIDDFYGWVKYHCLLRLLDGYPMKLPVKCSFVYKAWKYVYITSNKKPEDWYAAEFHPYEPLRRRFDRILEVNDHTRLLKWQNPVPWYPATHWNQPFRPLVDDNFGDPTPLNLKDDDDEKIENDDEEFEELFDVESVPSGPHAPEPTPLPRTLPVSVTGPTPTPYVDLKKDLDDLKTDYDSVIEGDSFEQEHEADFEALRAQEEAERKEAEAPTDDDDEDSPLRAPSKRRPPTVKVVKKAKRCKRVHFCKKK